MAKEVAIVQVSVAPVLAARSWQSEQVTQALLGAPVVVLEKEPDWALVRMEDGYEGWISAGHLAQGPLRGDRWVAMTDLWVNLRRRPDFRMPARLAAPIGTRLPLRNQQPGWLGVALPGGGAAWLEEHRGRIEEPGYAPPAPDADELLATARRFQGVPYLWGGCSPWGLDCSGLVQLVFRLHGIRLPRDADQQALEGQTVTFRGSRQKGYAGLQGGDAVFFHSAESRARITHVALALDGEAFIHAAGGDRVRVDRWAESSYGERLAGARRFLALERLAGVQNAMGLA